MLSNPEIIYIVYYVVERILSLLFLGKYGSPTFGILLGFIINLGIIHLLVKYNFNKLTNVVLSIGILFSVISQILCFKNLTSCNLREGNTSKEKKEKESANRNKEIKKPPPPPPPPSPPQPPNSPRNKNKERQRRIRKILTQNKNSDITNRRNRRNNPNSNWNPYTSSELSEDLFGSDYKYNN
jgi:type IV secretory pathway VirB10-like protein